MRIRMGLESITIKHTVIKKSPLPKRKGNEYHKLKNNEMKITHSDHNTWPQLQWTRLPCRNNSKNVRGSSVSSAESDKDKIKNEELFPRSRFHHAACSQGRYVYIFGGKDRCVPLKDLWRLDTVTQEWKQIEDKEMTIPHLQGHTMVSYKSQLLIFGGTFNDSPEDTPLWIYNTDLNHIRQYISDPCSPQPRGRREHSAVIYKNAMYIYGGFLDDSGTTDEFWYFGIAEEDWRLLGLRKPGKRHGHVAVIVGGSMWLHGGMKGLTPLSDLWTFNFGMKMWNKIKGVGVSPALSNHRAHVINNSLLLLGGSCNGELSQSVWIFSLDNRTWRQILMPERDVCPPVTLHATVLLTAADMEGSKIDQSKSVPQLKERAVTFDQSIRPWTSPGPISSHDQSNPNSLMSHSGYDILQLDVLTSDLDTNNNESRENLCFESQHVEYEAETSFCSGKENINYGSPQVESSDDTDRVKRPGIIRPASSEHCDDALPLLQRFQSVASDTDFGENNLTLTLSDEHIFQENKSSQPSDLIKARLGCSLERLCFSHEKPFTSDTDTGRVPLKMLLKDTKVMECMSRDFVNPLYTNLFEGSAGGYPRNTPLYSKWGSSQSSIVHLPLPKSPGKENAPPKSRYDDDLIVEDLELSDMEQTLHNVSLAYPSNSFLKSSSLKDLSPGILKNKICAETNISEVPIKEQAKSCGNIAACQNSEMYSNKLHPSSLHHEKNGFKNYSAKELVDAEFTSIAVRLSNAKTPGIYVKNQNTASGQRPSHHVKNKGHLQRLFETEKQSIGTQTSGSLLSLQSPVVKNLPVARESKFQHFMVDADSHAQNKASVRSPEPDLKGQNSILSGFQQCILVIGGHTDEYPSFQPEPLEMRRCHLKMS